MERIKAACHFCSCPPANAHCSHLWSLTRIWSSLSIFISVPLRLKKYGHNQKRDLKKIPPYSMNLLLSYAVRMAPFPDQRRFTRDTLDCRVQICTFPKLQAVQLRSCSSRLHQLGSFSQAEPIQFMDMEWQEFASCTIKSTSGNSIISDNGYTERNPGLICRFQDLGLKNWQ